MEQSTITEHDCNVLGGLFQIIINDLKNGSSTWDDFILKATKFHTNLKSTILASTAFLDSFQKIADMATTTRGGTKEIGTALTRLCLRQRSVEAKLKSFNTTFYDCLILPLQERVEEWKKTTVTLDKERTKELKRLRQEFKKRQFYDSTLLNSSSIGNNNTNNSNNIGSTNLNNNNRTNKKHSSRSFSKSKFDFFDTLNAKSIYGTIGGGHSHHNSNYHHKSTSSLTRSLDSEIECNERLLMLEELEKKSLRRALIEERSHFCLLIKFLQPFIEEEISMISEISHIQEIMDSLIQLSNDPFDLPPSCEQVITNLKLNKNETTKFALSNPFYQNYHSHHHNTPPSSPSSLGSRKSSMCSISSYNSSSSTINNNSISNYLSYHNHHPHHAHHNQQSNKYFSTPRSPAENSQFTYGSSYSENNLINKKYNNSNSNDELQFQIDSIASSNNDTNDHSTKTTKTIKITSTNPFLNSYNQIQNKNNDTEDTQTSSLYQSKNDDSTSSQSFLLPSSSSTTTANHESDGSITPTNNDNNTFTNNNSYKNPPKPNKPPPLPPVRRTSSLSNPNAITMSTLRKNYENNRISTDDDQNQNIDQNLSLKNSSLYDEINVLTKSMNDINFTLKNSDFSNLNNILKQSSNNNNNNNKESNNDENKSENNDDKHDYKNVKKLFENFNNQQPQSNLTIKSIDLDDQSQLPLPAPPPEAFIADNSTTSSAIPIAQNNTNNNNSNNTNQSQQQHHQQQQYNKITNVHREFLETLNSKLSQSPLVAYHHHQQHQNNVKMSKRRNSSSSSGGRNDDNNSIISSIPIPGKHNRHSHRSQSASRSSSRKNSIEKNNGYIVSNSLNNESFIDKLSQTLLNKHHHHHQHNQQLNAHQQQMNEIAKAAASTALQRKQSVPELNTIEQMNSNNTNNNNSMKNQNRIFSSSLNLSTNNSNQQQQHTFQVVEIQTNSTQQPIYASRNQLQRELNNLYGTNFYTNDNQSSSASRSYYYNQQQQMNGFFNKL